jgi:hypothetical protein
MDPDGISFSLELDRVEDRLLVPSLVVRGSCGGRTD